jgi:hypothetical protein
MYLLARDGLEKLENPTGLTQKNTKAPAGISCSMPLVAQVQWSQVPQSGRLLTK